MKKKNNKKNNKKIIYSIIIIVIILLIIVPLFVYISVNSSNKEIEEEFNKEGYKTSKEDAFYRQITTNNTLDEYYEDVANEKDSEYQEFYYSKLANDFIEVKMLYKNKVNTTLNITTDLKTNELEYNYELAYKNAHLILEGNSKDNYACNVITNNKINSDTVTKYCNMIIEEINDYNTVKDELLKNKKIKDLSDSSS